MEKSNPDEERRENLMEDLKIIQSGTRVEYNPESVEEVVRYLEIVAEIFTIHCKEYEDFIDYLRCLVQSGLGAYTCEFPIDCFKSVDN